MTPNRDALNRRSFLRDTGGLLALSAFHSVAGSARPADAAPTESAARGPKAAPYHGPEIPRILRLDLRTAAPLDELEGFYHGALGLEVVNESAGRLELQAGRTRLVFHAAGPDEGEPFYHFAFNIPENKLWLARDWQLERSPLLRRPPDAYSHPDYDDVTDFWHWNAHSIFFGDPAGNLVEYIARHDLPNAASGPFTSRDILYASEIGFVADDVPALGEELAAGTGLGVYYAAGDRFRALGDPNGLLLVLQEGVRSWARRADWARFDTRATIRAPRAGRVSAQRHPYEVLMEV